jgi:hypothetical protein
MDLTSQLIRAFIEDPGEICGRHDPVRVVRSVVDLEQRLNILTLGSVLDINPLSEARWVALVSLGEHWLLKPSEVAYQSSQQVQNDMQDKGILGPGHIPRVWWQICRGVQGRFEGSWRALLADNDDQASMVKDYLRRNKATFPVLAGPVVAVRWLDLIKRIGDANLTEWEALRVPLPKGQRNNARLLGIEDEQVHPLLFNALYLWHTACRRFSIESCGFEDCPKR